MRFLEDEALSFDDLLLVPQFSGVASRSKIDLSMRLDDKFTLTLPVISSPMTSITESLMAGTMALNGGLGIIHRYCSIDQQVELVKNAGVSKLGAAIGVNGDWQERLKALYGAGVDLICIDVAHGHHEMVLSAISYIKYKYPKIHVMAGNVATLGGFRDLEKAGADSIRVGVGSGSVCKTRTVTGHGLPLAESLRQISNGTESYRKAKIIADGGMRHPDDIVKAFALGADAVILGNMLAATTECPGEIVMQNIGGVETPFKRYYGMASASAQQINGSKRTPEGVEVLVQHKTSVIDILDEIRGGIQSGCSYSGVSKLSQLHDKAVFRKISFAGLRESVPHAKVKL